jgi:hypothetical protein
LNHDRCRLNDHWRRLNHHWRRLNHHWCRLSRHGRGGSQGCDEQATAKSRQEHCPSP